MDAAISHYISITTPKQQLLRAQNMRLLQVISGDATLDTINYLESLTAHLIIYCNFHQVGWN